MEIFQESVELYLARLAPRHLPPVFEALHAEATRRAFPIVGPEVGRFFMQIARLRRAKRVLELGSGFGYSAIWFALGCGEGAEIHCTEYNEDNIAAGRVFARQAGVENRLHWHSGEALGNARAIPGNWDIIFCDIDKEDYPQAYDFARERMRMGDVLLFDNVLWHGRVAEPAGQHDEQTARVIELTTRAYADNGMDVSLLPIRDGILMCVKK